VCTCRVLQAAYVWGVREANKTPIHYTYISACPTSACTNFSARPTRRNHSSQHHLDGQSRLDMDKLHHHLSGFPSPSLTCGPAQSASFYFSFFPSTQTQVCHAPSSLISHSLFLSSRHFVSHQGQDDAEATGRSCAAAAGRRRLDDGHVTSQGGSWARRRGRGPRQEAARSRVMTHSLTSAHATRPHVRSSTAGAALHSQAHARGRRTLSNTGRHPGTHTRAVRHFTEHLRRNSDWIVDMSGIIDVCRVTRHWITRRRQLIPGSF
jgi:hypothetical protein